MTYWATSQILTGPVRPSMACLSFVLSPHVNGSCGTLGNMTTHRNELLWGEEGEKLFPVALVSQDTVGTWPLYRMLRHSL